MKKEVNIEKWVDNNKAFYWIVDSSGEPIDGFSKKWQAIDAIKRWNMVRLNKSVKIRE